MIQKIAYHLADFTPGTAQYSTVQYSTEDCLPSGRLHSQVLYSTVQYSTVQYSTKDCLPSGGRLHSQVLYSTVQYSTVQKIAYHLVAEFTPGTCSTIL